MLSRLLPLALVVAGQASAFQSSGKARDLAAALGRITLDPEATYRVRDLQLNRSDAKFYLTEGILSFFVPLDGRITGAVFTTENVEGGDGEVLILPPVRSERASLTTFTGSPNLNEHLRAAIFFFSDDTAEELLHQIPEPASHKLPEAVEKLRVQFDPAIRNMSRSVDLHLVQSLLDYHAKADGFFYAGLFGRTLSFFNVLNEPRAPEPITIGQGTSGSDGGDVFQLWAAFRPRRAAPFIPPSNRFSNYRIETTIRNDLTLEATADFDYLAADSDGQVLRFDLSDRLRVLSASIDGHPAEVLERSVMRTSEPRTGGSFLLVAESPLSPTQHHVSVRYGGGVIRQTSTGTYFVDDRTNWFPQSASLLSTFDLVFHCPERLALVSTGELISDEVQGEIRSVHRRASVPRPFAGFNLGRYNWRVVESPQYRVEVYSDQSATTPISDIPEQAQHILDFYTKEWDVVPTHTLAISPIAGYFGQGFPGLVYLSEAAYIRPEDRSPVLRTPRFDTFLSRLLLPHEIAHQWWGNLITSATYRSGWLVEALATYSALQFLESKGGEAAASTVLDQYRTDLTAQANGQAVEAAGPLDWGTRLLSSRTPSAWQTIVYGKGAWVLHMLRRRLGDANFLRFEQQLLSQFAQRPFTNEDVRLLGAQLLERPSGDGAAPVQDRELEQFFDTWVYNTGIPQLRLRRDRKDWVLDVYGVADDFTIDVPLSCATGTGQRSAFTLRATKGENSFPAKTRSFATCSLPPPREFLYTN